MYKVGERVAWTDKGSRKIGTIIKVTKQTGSIPASYLIKFGGKVYSRYESTLTRV